MSTHPALDWQGADTDATIIERQAAHLWQRLSHEVGEQGAVRTHIYNLVVYTSDRTEEERVREVLDNLAGRHPSRAIILVTDRRQPQPSIDASVRVSCVSVGSSRSPLCHEQITVVGHGRAADHLTSVVIPLLMPELRTYLWWPGQPSFGHRTFHQLLTLADQLVVDSAQFHSPGDGLANLARMCQQKQGVNDFNWTRLTPWREIIAQFFDGPTWARYASGIRAIHLVFGMGGPYEKVTGSTLLLLGWMASQLGWQVESALDGLLTTDQTLTVVTGERVIPIEVRFEPTDPMLQGRFLRVEIVAQPRDEPPARFTLERTEDARRVNVSTRVHDGAEIRRTLPLPLRPEVELLAYELELAGHDPLYETAVQSASELAGRELWAPV